MTLFHEVTCWRDSTGIIELTHLALCHIVTFIFIKEMPEISYPHIHVLNASYDSISAYSVADFACFFL